MMTVVTAESLGIPEIFNVATYFVDRNVTIGRGTNVAIECGDVRITYDEVHRNVNRCGNALRRIGVRPEERVLLLLYDGPVFVYSFFGAIKFGAVPVPLNTLWRAADYQYVIRDSRASALIVSAALLPVIQSIAPADRPSVRHIIVTSAHGSSAISESTHTHTQFGLLLAQGAGELAAEPTSRDAPAFWLYSSGSTGKPKGCVHLHHDMVICAELFGKGVLGIRATDRCFSVAKLFFAYGLGNALTFPLSVGATTVLMAERPTPAAVFKRWVDHGVTVFFGAPTGYAGMLAASDLPARTDVKLRLCSSAGEALPREIGERFTSHFGCEIVDGLGSTEMLHIFLSNRPGQVQYGSTGQVVPGYRLRLVNEAGGEAGPGEIGDLFVAGPSSALMYWGQRDKSRATFQGEWTKTGDKYSIDERGCYVYAGRSDDMLKVSGIYVSPFEVEATLMQHPAVLESAVIGVEDADGLTKTKACVVRKPGREVDEAELKAFVKERLAAYKYPRVIEFIAELPKTATGKIQRFRLRDLERERSGSGGTSGS